ncbi:hypothetical protein ACF06W_11280 [Streptomyces albus]|uniref:hypothetical protein n=1 Tax=Streptomyces albus TaxID=1888 RepID=UPI0037014087
MSGYGSIRAVREVITDTLKAEGRNPNAYNITGIARDAFHDRGRGWGYGAGTEEEWRAAVDKHRRPFGIGDMVRVVVTVDGGHTEHHYGRISQFRKANGGIYRGQPVKPHSAYIELDHHTRGWLGPLADVTPALDDFEIVREWGEVHRGALNPNGYFHCLRCAFHTYKGAQVLIVHKRSGQRVRVCESCFSDNELARLGHDVLFYERSSRDTIAELRAKPELITAPASDSHYAKSEGETYREWADSFPWMVPAEAAEMYAAWKQGLATAG